MGDNLLPENLIDDESGGGGAVESVNGQTGEVVLDAEDVGAAEETHSHVIGDLPTGTSGTTVALGNHTHAASAVTSGQFAIAQIPTGTTSSTVALGDHTHNGLMTGSATAVADAAGDTPTGTEFNDLLTALRARGVIS